MYWLPVVLRISGAHLVPAIELSFLKLELFLKEIIRVYFTA